MTNPSNRGLRGVSDWAHHDPGIRRIALAGRQRLRRSALRPFRPDVGRPLLVHAAHHRAGTVWLFNVYSLMGLRFGLKTQKLVGPGPVNAETDIALFEHAGHISQSDVGDRAVRGTHMVRDPRDVVISSYFYHLWTDEEWAHQPRPGWGGTSYQEELRQLGEHDGLLAEIERFLAYGAPEYSAWDYHQANFLELRYEDVLTNEAEQFRRVFTFLGLKESAVDTCVALADSVSFSRLAGRPVGQTTEQQHLRSGTPGQWRNHFRPAHVAAFKAGAGRLLVQLGYEADDDW